MPPRWYSLVVRASVYQAVNLGSNLVQSSQRLETGSPLQTAFKSSCLTFCIEGDNVLGGEGDNVLGGGLEPCVLNSTSGFSRFQSAFTCHEINSIKKNSQ